MKKLNLLKNIVSLFFIFQVVGIVMSLIIAMMNLFEEGKLSIPIDINGRTIEVADFSSKIIILIVCLGYIAFVYGVFLFGYTIELFSRKIIFDDRIINNFNKMGKTFLAAILLTTIPSFFPNIAKLKGHLNPDIIMGGFDSLLFKISLALFFFILSRVFKMAKEIKEENELTI